MLRSLWLLFVYLAFLGLGTAAPFVMTLGYVWVDTFRPQEVASIVLNQLPVALIMGAGAMLSYFALDRRSPPPLTLQSALQVLMAVWMTLTLLWAEVPLRALEKWDWAFKVVMFAAFLPLVIRSRIQIEAFAQVYVFALAANFIPFGVKVMLSGGGYGRNLGLMGGNSGLAEGGYLSTVCLMAVPLALYLGKHGKLMPNLRIMPLAYAGVALLALITAIGTYQRSALIGLGVLGLYMFMRSRRKLLFGAIALMVGVIVAGIAMDSWSNRGATMADYKTESSALIRVLVWKWTLGYVTTHPMGGGFDSYLINTIVIPGDDANPGGMVQNGRAFHSIYFEVLGELGIPGFLLFVVLSLTSLFSLRRLASKCRKIPDLVWVADMSDAVQAGLMVFLSSGAFVGIAFQPPYWYFVSMGICLHAYVWHAARAEDNTAKGWRASLARPAAPGGSAPVPAWRAGPSPGPVTSRPDTAPGTGVLPVPGWRDAARVRREA